MTKKSNCDPRCVDGYCILTNSSACRLSDAALSAGKPADDSYIQHGPGGTLLSGPDATNLFRAMTLASALGLYAKCGLIPTRGVTITKMLAMATEYTGKKYKRGDAARAQADVKKWADEMKAALPVIVEVK